ncbi:MAG TPA: hypothetical protein VH210_00165 [Gaiellaceae bacterium]|jgi:hypothetical protein|nr:hypothetical protein [Gaiellaceae bacterium]
MKRIVLRTLVLLLLAALSATALATTASPGPISPTTRAAATVKAWRAHLRTGALADPKRHFPNPSHATLTARLRLAASRYHFTVVKVEIVRPLQDAPLVVVTTKNKHALAASTAAILRVIDPKAQTNDDRTGWSYEGFLLEARDNHGVPFLATFNWWRGPHAGGGQWAADPSLYPFAHG